LRFSFRTQLHKVAAVVKKNDRSIAKNLLLHLLGGAIISKHTRKTSTTIYIVTCFSYIFLSTTDNQNLGTIAKHGMKDK
jgi:hypothetical protein